MPITTLNGADAWRTAARSPSLSDRRGAFEQLVYPAAYAPKFAVAAADRFFCIGSCFARNIEEHLIYRGVEVLSKLIYSPYAEWKGRPNGVVNKFTTHSMLNELVWQEEGLSVTPDFFCETEAGFRDLHLSTGAAPTGLERAIERRLYLIEDYFSRLRTADVVVMTLGLNEVWKDQRSGLYLNTPPPMGDTRREPGRYLLEVTDAAENTQTLEAVRQRLMRLNPAVRIVVTVSPVSLEHSFTGEDVVVANVRSKAVLRASAAAFAALHANVDYFPSFEMITCAPRAGTIHPDGVHITDAAVGAVIGSFFAAHGLPADPPEPDFNEVSYLQAHPDVDAACRAGEMVSGYHHWLAFGRGEGRKLSLRG